MRHTPGGSSAFADQLEGERDAKTAVLYALYPDSKFYAGLFPIVRVAERIWLINAV